MDYTEKAKYHMKIIVCGAGAVGKTSIVRRFVEKARKGLIGHNCHLKWLRAVFIFTGAANESILRKNCRMDR